MRVHDENMTLMVTKLDLAINNEGRNNEYHVYLFGGCCLASCAIRLSIVKFRSSAFTLEEGLQLSGTAVGDDSPERIVARTA